MGDRKVNKYLTTWKLKRVPAFRLNIAYYFLHTDFYPETSIRHQFINGYDGKGAVTSTILASHSYTS